MITIFCYHDVRKTSKIRHISWCIALHSFLEWTPVN